MHVKKAKAGGVSSDECVLLRSHWDRTPKKQERKAKTSQQIANILHLVSTILRPQTRLPLLYTEEGLFLIWLLVFCTPSLLFLLSLLAPFFFCVKINLSNNIMLFC